MRLAPAWLATTAVLGCGFSPAPAAESPQVVILGFDGADARLVERWMDEGKLPHLSNLRDEGAYAPLEPTNPPQTPVSWSSFATGTNPGKTEIFDFLKRDPKDYLPDFAMNSESRRTFLFGARNGPDVGAAAGVVEAMRTVLFDGDLPGAVDTIYTAVAALVALTLGAWVFSRVDDRTATEV